MKKKIVVILAAMLMTLTVGTALPQVSADYFGTSVNAISTNELSISKGILSLGKGETYRLTANQSVKWRTSNSKLLTVDQSGNVKAVGVGTAWITAKSSSGAEKSCKITVKSAPSKVSISKGVLTIGVGEEYTLSAVVPDGSAAAVRTFRTSDSKVAKMLSTNWTGKFKALKPGTAYITVRLYNGKEASCKVTVKNAPSKVTLSKGVLTLGVGESYNLTASMPDGCGSAQRSFRTSNSKVVRITKSDWTGSFVAVKPGVAYVTVRTFNGKEAACKVTVKNAPKSVSVSKKTLTMTVGETKTLSSVIDKNSGCASRTFRTSNSSVVLMTNTDWTGRFFAVKPGTAYVTVRTYNGKEASCKVTVKNPSSKPNTSKENEYKIETLTPGVYRPRLRFESKNGKSIWYIGDRVAKKGDKIDIGGRGDPNDIFTFDGDIWYNALNDGTLNADPQYYPTKEEYPQWKASDHEKDKVYSSGGYVMYEMPEILPYVNYYRRQAGVPELEWSSGNAYYNKIKNMFYNLSKEEQKQIRNESPEYFNSRGEFDAKKFVDTDNMSTRNCLEYCLKTHTLDHGNEYDGHSSLINGTMGSYNPKRIVEGIKTSPGHWEGLMDPELTTLYVVYAEGDGTGFTITFD